MAVDAAVTLIEGRADALMANRRSLLDRVLFPSLAGELRQAAKHVESLKYDAAR